MCDHLVCCSPLIQAQCLSFLGRYCAFCKKSNNEMKRKASNSYVVFVVVTFDRYALEVSTESLNEKKALTYVTKVSKRTVFL